MTPGVLAPSGLTMAADGNTIPEDSEILNPRPLAAATGAARFTTVDVDSADGAATGTGGLNPEDRTACGNEDGASDLDLGRIAAIASAQSPLPPLSYSSCPCDMMYAGVDAMSG